ncbi:MAG: HAD-IA family hydrolase [Actinobacteria bacterium]|nr:HAD-IA family hydrolase [Actinomycetota bacterium]
MPVIQAQPEGNSTQFRAVLFDLGGVVFPSPFDAFDAYEKEEGLSKGFVRAVIARSAEDGAWARLERSDVTFEEFCSELEGEALLAGEQISAAQLMAMVGSSLTPRREMVAAINALRDIGLLIGALTNNWALAGGRTDARPHSLGHLGLFDIVVESAIEGMRKPDPRIYELTCERLAVKPSEVVFLDDLGINLKPARAMGMTTIKVADVGDALNELGEIFGIAL